MSDGLNREGFEDGPYAGLGPYGIAVTALERILELDTGWMSWDEARAIASEARGLAVAASVVGGPCAIASEARGLALRAAGVADAAEREPEINEVEFEDHRWYTIVRQDGKFLRAFAGGGEFSGLGTFDTEAEFNAWMESL